MADGSSYEILTQYFARANGVDLMVLEEVDTSGAIKITTTTLGYARMVMKKTPLVVSGASRQGYSYIAEAIAYEPEFRESLFHPDFKWLREKLGPLEDDELKKRIATIHISAPPNEIKLTDVEGNEVGDIQKVYKNLVLQLQGEEGVAHEMSHTFEAPTFLRTSDAELPLVKLESITSNVIVNEKEHVSRPVRLPDIAQFVLRNIGDGTARIWGKRVAG